MDYGAIAAGAAGATSGLFGVMESHKQDKANRREARRQFDLQTNESIQRRVQDALKAGINPLAALGASTNASPTIHAGGYSGAAEGYSQIGSGLSKALQGAFAEKQADDMEFDSQAKELDLEHQRLQNQYLKNQIRMQKVPGNDVEPAPSMQGEQLLFQPVYDIEGRPRLVVNQNALEADSDNPGYMSSIISTIASGMKKGQIDPVSGDIKSDQLRMMLDDYYYQTTGHHIKNLESLYISPSEAAMAATMLARGVS